MRFLKWIFGLLAALGIAYFIGPKAEPPDLSVQPVFVKGTLQGLQDSIRLAEAKVVNIRPDNEARIIWADSVPQKTKYAIVYLHGFSASQEEGDPMHEELAKRYNCNLFLPRLAGHGLVEEEPMLTLKAEEMLASANRAIGIGKRLGEKVILVTTSTGGTFGLYLAQNDPDIAAILLYSPNIDILNETSHLLTKPWGLQVARMVVGSDYNYFELDSTRVNYWTNKYRLEALIQLRYLLDITMVPETFANVTQPVFLGYYYKNDAAMDSTVSVPAMLKMYDQLGTPKGKKTKVAFPNAKHHVIASRLTSKDLASVRKETYIFLEDIVGLKPQSDTTQTHKSTISAGAVF